MGFPDSENITEQRVANRFPRLDNMANEIRLNIGHNTKVFFAIIDVQNNKSIVVAQSHSQDGDPDITSYDLANTPCQIASSRGFCSFSNPAERFPLDAGLQKMGIQHYLGAEIQLNQHFKGLLVTLSKEPLPDETIHDYFEMTGIENGRFAEALYYSMRQLIGSDKTITMTELQHATRNAMLKALINRNRETARHCAVVKILTLLLANRLGITSLDELDKLKYMALLHDIGKLKVPQYIIDKPGPPTEEEWIILRKHADYSMDILNETISLQGLDDGVLYHQERWDGKGYPKGLKGEEIPLYARIIAGADKLAAIMEPRVYNRNVPTIEKMREILEAMSGHELDPVIVEHLLALLELEPIQQLLLHQADHTDRLLGPIFE